MFSKKYFALILSLGVVCESSFVDKLVKCSKDDGKCQGNNIQETFKALSKGFSEFNIPPIDPMPVNQNITFFDAINLSINGEVRGVSKCIVDKYTPNIDAGSATMKLKCGVIEIIGKYNLFSDNLKAIMSFLNGSINTESKITDDSSHGDGEGKIKIENFLLNLKFHFNVVKKGDDIFFIIKKDKIVYTYDIGKLTIAANKIYLGGVESSASIIPLLNQNSKPITQLVGGQVMEIAVLNYVIPLVDNIFKSLSTKHFIIEDLSSYVTE